MVAEGMDSIPKRLRSRVERDYPDRVRIVLGCRVVDVKRSSTGAYDVVIRRKKKDSGIFYTQTRHFDMCVIATPPRFIQEWTVGKLYLRPLVHSIGTLPLHHVYVQNPSSQPPSGTFDPTPHGLVVSGDHDQSDPPSRAYFQFFYSCGRTARFWNNLATSYPKRLFRELRSLFRSWMTTKGNSSASADFDEEQTDVRSHYWPHAVHYWKPSFAFPQNPINCVKKAVYPHPHALPRLYCVGEAYSSVQGWIEGALQTSEIALQYIQRDMAPRAESKTVKRPPRLAAVRMNIGGRSMDVRLWKHRHPGSRQLIEKYASDKVDDATDMFESVGHSEGAWRILFHLSVD